MEKVDDCIAISIGELEDAGEENLVFGEGRHRCKLFVGEKEICSVQGWNRIKVETTAAKKAVRILEAK